MAEAAILSDDARVDAARIAYALLRVEEPMARPLRAESPPGHPAIGHDAYIFTPSWRPVRREDVVPFLVSLASPALLSPTTTRCVVALTLLHDLSGDRRRWGEKTITNSTACLDSLAAQLGLTSSSPILVELADEAAVYPLATLRLWTQQFGVQVGWALSPLAADARAQAQLAVRRSDGTWTPPLVCHLPPDRAT